MHLSTTLTFNKKSLVWFQEEQTEEDQLNEWTTDQRLTSLEKDISFLISFQGLLPDLIPYTVPGALSKLHPLTTPEDDNVSVVRSARQTDIYCDLLFFVLNTIIVPKCWS